MNIAVEDKLKPPSFCCMADHGSWMNKPVLRNMTEVLSADIVVVGSGICGSLSARRLARAGASVLILEAGPRMDRARIVANFRNGAFKGSWMGPYPERCLGAAARYQPGEDNGYLVQAGPDPYPAEYLRAMVGGTTSGI